MNLKQQTFSAVRWTTLAFLSKAVLQFLQVVILARLLTPEDFGLIALVVSIITFAQIFTDMGVSNAIIHRQYISHDELSSIYWLNVLSGITLTILLIVISPLIAGFYNVPSLGKALMLISLYFTITAIGQQVKVIAEKELRFSELARVEVFASIIGFIVSVTWAYISPSVFALIMGLLTTALITTVLLWGNIAKGWRPLIRLRFSEIRSFLKFGIYMMANNLVNTFNQQIDILIGARFLTPTSLGIYGLPRDLCLRLGLIINPIVTRVGFPVMAKVQDDKDKLKSVYLKTVRMTASINFPLYVGIAIFAPEVIRVIFGEKWQSAIPILRVLAIWGLVRASTNPVGSLIFALGKADLAFKWNLSLMFLIFPSIWIGTQYGNYGLAVSMLFVNLIFIVPSWLFLIRPLCNAGFFEYMNQLIIPLWISIVSVSFGYISVIYIESAAFRLEVSMVTSVFFYLLLSRLFNKIWYGAMKELIFIKST